MKRPVTNYSVSRATWWDSTLDWDLGVVWDSFRVNNWIVNFTHGHTDWIVNVRCSNNNAWNWKGQYSKGSKIVIICGLAEQTFLHIWGVCSQANGIEEQILWNVLMKTPFRNLPNAMLIGDHNLISPKISPTWSFSLLLSNVYMKIPKELSIMHENTKSSSPLALLQIYKTYLVVSVVFEWRKLGNTWKETCKYQISVHNPTLKPEAGQQKQINHTRNFGPSINSLNLPTTTLSTYHTLPLTNHPKLSCPNRMRDFTYEVATLTRENKLLVCSHMLLT